MSGHGSGGSGSATTTASATVSMSSASTTTTTTTHGGGHGHTQSGESLRQDKARKYTMYIFCYIGAGVVGLLFVRHLILSVERMVHYYRRRAANKGVGCKTRVPYTQPFFARNFNQVERHLFKPVPAAFTKYFLMPAEWTWITMLMLVALNVINTIANLIIAVTPKAGSGINVVAEMAVRTGYTATMHLPWLYALAGRNSIIGFLTGVDYQTLRVYHKVLGFWAFAEAFAHTLLYLCYYVYDGGGWSRVSGEWGNARKQQYLQWGTAAVVGAFFCLALGWGPVRRRGYELFLVTHVLGAVVFLVGAYKHRQREMYDWVWAAAAVWAFERACRLVKFVVSNYSFNRPVIQSQAQVQHGAILLSVPFPEGGWEAGQHFYLSFWGLALLRTPWLYGQSHPFTVANAPGPGIEHVEFVIRVHDGLTRTLARFILSKATGFVQLGVAIEGPYSSRPRVDEYERVLLVAGGSGITHPLSSLCEIIRRPRDFSATKEVTLVWAIHHLDQAQWVGPVLREARAYADAVGLELAIELYITREDSYSATGSSAASVSSSGADTPALSLEDEKKMELGCPAVGSDECGRAVLHRVRPDAGAIVRAFLGAGQEDERSIVLACGPSALGNDVRRAGAKAARVSDEVHVASFEW